MGFNLLSTRELLCVQKTAAQRLNPLFAIISCFVLSEATEKIIEIALKIVQITY